VSIVELGVKCNWISTLGTSPEYWYVGLQMNVNDISEVTFAKPVIIDISLLRVINICVLPHFSIHS